MLERTRHTQSTLIVGNGPDTSLVASLVGATRYTNIQAKAGELPSALWIASASSVPKQVIASGWHKVIVDQAQSMELVNQLPAKPQVVTSARAELERHFGRVSITNVDTEAMESLASARPKSVLWRLSGVLFATVLLVPTLLVVAAFWVTFRLLGVQKVFRRVCYVGRNGNEFLLTSIAPEIRSHHNPNRHFIARSLVRQVKRLHLANSLGLLSVLRGDMAIVGPGLMTPQQFELVVESLPAYRLRTAVRPGLISLARVRLGRTLQKYDFKRALEYDLYYIKHRTFLLDIRIVLRASYNIARDVVRTTVRVLGTGARLAGRVLRESFGEFQGSPARFVTPVMPHGMENKLTPVLVVGAGSAGEQLIESLRENPRLGMWPVAIADDDLSKLGTQLHGVPVIGTTESLNAIVAREGIEEIVIAMPSTDEVNRQRITELARSTGKPVYSIPTLHALLRGVSSTDLVNVQASDLLGRSVVEIDPQGALDLLQDKRVLVTGAAGSIGSEVVYQALRGEPSIIYGLDINESDLYDLQQALGRQNTHTKFVPIVGSLTDHRLVRSIMAKYRPDVVFHAGAYKHVPLMESFPREALKTNITGTLNIVSASAHYGVQRFVMVSTDKAVRPSSVMGASKRIAELIVREVGDTTGLSTCSVRFGNVLGSRGSVIPLFTKQIELGGPVTVTDERMTRYFMTIPEAAGLIIEAGAIGDSNVVYMLDMDEPVKIVDVAERLIRLKGLRPGHDIHIEFTGLRPGEKLFEELSLDFEEARPTRHPKIRVLHEGLNHDSARVMDLTENLLSIVDTGEPEEIRAEIMRFIEKVDGQVAPVVQSVSELAEPLPRSL